MPRRPYPILVTILALTALSLAPAGVTAAAAPDTLLAGLLARAGDLQSARGWAASDSVAALAFDRAEQRHPPDSTAMALALFYRGNSRYWRALFSDTVGTTYLARSIRIQRRLAHPDTGRWVATVDLFGRLLTDGDHPDSALVVLATGRALCRPPGAGADSMLAALWITTGRAYRRADRYDEAIAAYDSARMLRERRFGPEHASVAEALAEIGAIYGRSNRLEAASVALERALAILERTLGPESASLAAPLAELANVQNHAGEIARSIETLERDIAILSKANGPNSPRMIPPLYNIGLRLFDFGDFPGAYAAFAPLVARAEASFGAGNGRTENIRFMAGASAMMMGDTTAAAPHLTRARAELAGKPLDTNHIANQIERFYSMLLERRGDLAGARRVLDEGLARERATGQPIEDVLIQLLDSQASVEMASFDTLGLDRTLQEMETRFGDPSKAEGVFYAEYLQSRARAECWRGRAELASVDALLGEEIDRERLLRNVRALPDQRALQLASELGGPLDLVLSLSGGGGEPAIAAAWDRLVRWRGLVTAELARRRAPHEASADTALAGAHARWVRMARRAAQLEVAESGGDPGSALALSRAEAEAAERRYAALAAARGIARDTTPVDLPRIRAALSPDQALVSLVTVAARTDTARFIGFVTRGPGGALHRVDLGPARELLAHLAAWRAALEVPPARGHERKAERDCRRLGADVRARTWDRLAPLTAGARGVVLVADGALADLPWQALPIGANRYLVEEGPELENPGAERELLAQRARAGRGLLAIGDPEFGRAEASTDTARSFAAGDCRGAPAIALAQLPGARAEVDEIAREWNADHPGAPATLLVGAAGSERAFKADAPGREVLHIATHGILWGDRCAPVYAGLRGVGGMVPLKPATKSKRPASSRPPPASAAAPSPAAPPASPWSGRRVWLALAGANRARAGAADENEGLLTADEVVTLDLSDVDWVVLSACQSGVGQQWPLEGSIGMRRAFQLAGARAVIASQWSIADEATREWMRALYMARAGSATSASAAMREASRSVLESRRRDGRDTHPFYWAAFTATGR